MNHTDEDIKLEKISKLLELGGTMLAQHCQCGSPLFRYQGNVICPICNSQKKNKTGEEHKQQINRSGEHQQHVNRFNNHLDKKKIPKDIPYDKKPQIEKREDFNDYIAPTQYTDTQNTQINFISLETQEFISNIITKKIVQLCIDLQHETDLSRIKNQIGAIESGINMLKNLNNDS